MAAVPQRLPNRRTLAEDQEDAPPPLLPPRPAGRGMRPVPKAPVAVDSDDGSNSDPDDYVEPANKDAASRDAQPEEMYDDFYEEETPPPLPPHPSHSSVSADPEEIYDDCDETEQPGQEIYDDCKEELPAQREPPGPIVQHLPKKPVRNLPPPPPPEPARKIPPASSFPEEASVYEVGEEEESPPLPPPLPPPKDQRRAEPRLPPQPVGVTTPVSRPPGGPGLNIDPNQLQGLRKNLRKVSTDDKPLEKNTNTHDPKVYGECPQTVTEVKRKLEEKAEGRPGISPKPALLPKSCAVKTLNSNSSSSAITNGASDMNAQKSPRSQRAAGPQSTSDVTFLPKANKDKHTNVPLPPVPTPNHQPKPVLKFEPKPEEVIPPDPDEIYDDASSGDLLDKYEWFHGTIDRPVGESRVKSVGRDGTFLVRVSGKDPMFPYTLVVLHKGHVNNLRIRKRQKDGKFALGDEKSDELAFTDVPAMISHHKNHHVVLLGNNQSQVKLQHTPPKG